MVQAARDKGRHAGRTIGSYEIVELIGQGGLGEVYRGHDTKLDRGVALKVVRRDLLSDPQMRDRFLREARLASKVVHPYVATVFDVVEADGETFLVMEHIEGKRLDEKIGSEEISLDRRLGWCVEIAEALSAIHGHGLIHRDLKPSNVMTTEAGHVKVMDFGLVRPLPVGPGEAVSPTAVTQTELTTPGALIGTMPYMSPEQLKGKGIDARSDLFAFGVLLWEVATGTHPFRKPTAAETYASILESPPGGADGRRALPKRRGLERVVQRALEKNPADRYDSAEAVRRDLAELLGGDTRAVLRLRLALVMVLTLVAGSAIGAYAWLQTPPPMAGTRVAVALVPFADRTGLRDGEVRARMLTDLLAADLGASRIVRISGPESTVALVASLPPDATDEEVARRVARGMTVDYVLTGALYRERDRYVATLRGMPASGAENLPPLRADATSATGLAERLATSLRRSLPGVSAVAAFRDDWTDVAEATSESDEARLLYSRGLMLWSEGRLTDAIESFEGAVREDERFALARAALASVLDEAGYGRRAREEAARAEKDAPPRDDPASERAALSIRAVKARVFSRPDDFLKSSARLASLYPDEPEMLRQHADALVAVSDPAQALSVLDRAIKLDRVRPGLHYAKAGVLLGQEQLQKAHRSLDEAERLYALLGSREGTALVAERRGDIHSRAEEYAAGVDHFARAAVEYEAAGKMALAARAHMSAAKIDVLRGRPADADRRLSDVAEVARAVGNRDLLCRVLSGRGALRFLQGEFDGAEPILKEAVDLARSLESEPLLIEPLSNLASLQAYRGRPEPAQRYAEEALAIAKSLGSLQYEVNALILIATQQFRAGELDEAAASFAGAIERAGNAEDGQEDNVAWANLFLAEIELVRGRLGEALERAEAAESAYRALGSGYLGHALAMLASVRSSLGLFDEATAAIEEAEGIAGAPGAGLQELGDRCRLARAEAQVNRGLWAEAVRLTGELLALPPARTEGIGSRLRVVSAAASLGAGDATAAERRSREVLEAEAAAGSNRTRARALRAEALAALGRTDEALVEANRALDEAEARSILLSAARAAAVLVEHGSNDVRPDATKRGRAALGAFLTSVPEESRAAVLTRPDVRRLTAALGDGGVGSVEGAGRS